MLDHPGSPVKHEPGVPGERSLLAGVEARRRERRLPCTGAAQSRRSAAPPGMRRNYLVFFNTGIKVSGGGPREPSLLIVNTSPAGCPWQVTVIVLLVEV